MRLFKKTYISLICLLIVLSFVIQTTYIGFAANTEINTTEKNQLSYFDSNLYNNEQIIYLKKCDKLDDFINHLYSEYNNQKNDNLSEITKLLRFWNLSPNDNMETIKCLAAKVLNERFNIDIDSKDFISFVKAHLLDEKSGIVSVAEKDAEFGPLYLYMCIYYEILTESDYATKLLMHYKYDTITLSQLFDFDFNYNFSDTQIPILLYNYIENNAKAASTAWPSLYGYVIQQYAETWSNENNSTYHNPNYIFISDGGDCTNFASQCLYAGGLPMTSYVGEENNNGYVDTDTRWFYFSNNTSSGYSIATSWVRVKELYNYLSPHYACGEHIANATMSPYLNRGFLLQGKPLIGSYKHSVIITLNGNNVYYCAHSSQRHNEPISTFYSAYYKCRVVQVY